jgi:hypothetical protein
VRVQPFLRREVACLAVVAGCLALAACGTAQKLQAKAAPGEPVLIARWLMNVDARQWQGACALMRWTRTTPCSTGLRRRFGKQPPHFAGVVRVTHGFGRERISVRTGLIAAGTERAMVGLVNVYAGGMSVDGRPEVVLGALGPPLSPCTTHSPPCESA